MKLEPVYLVAPEPEPRGPTRRVLLGWALGYAAGAATIGFALGRVSSPTTPTQPPTDRDADAPEAEPRDHLQWAHQLAKGPAHELYASALGFLTQLNRHPEDRTLWRGVTRLARHIVDHPELDKAPRLAASILDFVDRLRPSDVAELDNLRPQLERIDWR